MEISYLNKLVLILLCLCCLVNLSWTQDTNDIQQDTVIEEYFEEEVYYEEDLGRAVVFDFNFTIADGQGRLGENLDQVLPGVSVSVLWQLQKEMPSFLGFKWDYLHHASYIYEFAAFIGPDLVDFDSRTSSNMMDLLADYRFFMPKRILGMDFYFDIQAGAKFLYTFTNTVAVDGGEGGDFSIDRFSVTPTYGGGMGLLIPIKGQYFINARTTFLNSLSAGYWALDPDPGIIADSRNAFLPRKSPVNVVQYELGVTYIY